MYYMNKKNDWKPRKRRGGSYHGSDRSIQDFKYKLLFGAAGLALAGIAYAIWWVIERMF